MTKGPAPIPVAERFWPKVNKLGPDDCWEWQASKDRKGYGTFGVQLNGMNRVRRAHQIAWCLANKRETPPEGTGICHTCDNPPCCNPAHLWPGTALDNMRDMAAKGRGCNQKKTHCPHGHEYSPENTRIDKSGHRYCRPCEHWRKKQKRLKAAAARKVAGLIAFHRWERS